MITFKNIATGESVNVYDIKNVNGVIQAGMHNGKEKGKKFIAQFAHIFTEYRDENDVQCFKLNEGWEVVTGKGERKPRQPKAKKDEPKVEQPTKVEEMPTQESEQPAEHENSNEEKCNEQALIAAIKNLRGGAVDINKVREIVAEELSKLQAQDPVKFKQVQKAVKRGDEVYCEDFDRMLSKLSRGNNIYLFGPAGSGKSHTAEQLAQALGLPFYGQTTIQFAHDVRGYGDAGGNFVDTPFFKAFSTGGVYFQDEYDRSNAEAAIVLNTALANKWYDFPVVGRVEMHENFRFVAAGNTLMQGPDEQYITGQTIDPSSRDRFGFFFEVGYNHIVEMRIAGNNEEIVSFVEDARNAVAKVGINHVISYRATYCMRDEVENENDLVACCKQCIFKGLEVDAVREIYGALEDKNNVWARATKKLF